MSNEVKSYPASTKKLYCVECREPIASREDLYVVLKDGANRAIHPQCHRKLDEMGLVNAPTNSLVKRKRKKLYLFAGSISLIMALYLFWQVYSNFDFDWFFSTSLIVLLSIFAMVISPILGAFIANIIESKQLWKNFEKHLPATCRECHKEIPPSHKSCPACGWKYTQLEARLTHKVTK